MDAFFTSVEQRDRPELRGKPVVVGGDPRGRGVVAAASYEARRYGIHSAMSCAEAWRRCPAVVFVEPRRRRYVEVSRVVRAIFHEVTDLVEPLSIDEAYLDVTENLVGLTWASDVARHVKARIKEETGLTASAGVGPNKLVAKIASDWRKPDGLFVVPPERVFDFIGALPVEKLWGVGPATARRLHGLGLKTAKDLRERPLPALRDVLGRQADALHLLASGIDERKVTPTREPKSQGSEWTFDHDVRDLGKLRESLEDQVASVVAALSRIRRRARTVTVKVRYDDFTTITRSRTLATPTDEERVVREVALDLLTGQTEAGERPVRLIGVTLSGFEHEDAPMQLELPWEGADRAARDGVAAAGRGPDDPEAA
ncbi:MAG: DNA polymerase IV [Deltaproteobacteria bacterium]|nr:DNA polymerase IV [Deltaproteobacteria bacterium]